MQIKFAISAHGLMNVLTKPNGKNWILLEDKTGTHKGFLSSIQREDGSGNRFNCEFYVDGLVYKVYVKCVPNLGVEE